MLQLKSLSSAAEKSTILLDFRGSTLLSVLWGYGKADTHPSIGREVALGLHLGPAKTIPILQHVEELRMLLDFCGPTLLSSVLWGYGKADPHPPISREVALGPSQDDPRFTAL